ncbi:MAG: biotin--[acetyl-CoA-carboxylase] ligase [Muricauda sp.]|nr:biotin--[acetyl-CoA-carboxylase] ligase [Allomuricauda sp.]MAU26199.1 biotin--[acetyl-CoA-carboxylase] ligase [Allomuricauda sp.]MBC31590.1 biotin--[acetyl-CoA-carboxylase] ligase [Allomuricauda sp.]|tara:strand:- start:26093 stop:26824 length:732 start_codon:yes stop_codon:yes gene_type:complete
MQIIKLDATDSTNRYLKVLALENKLPDFTFVTTKDQRQGRGQMGSKWQSEPGKNLTFSVLKKFNNQPAIDNFTINMVVSLSIIDVLKTHAIEGLAIKWPNDILSGSSKIAGILIENILKGPMTEYSIIGVGLNVNQTDFGDLTRASSLKTITGHNFELDTLLQELVEAFQRRFGWMERNKTLTIRNTYEEALFRKDKPSTFEDQEGNRFVGIIRGVSSEGKLCIESETDPIRYFDLKEVSLLY